MRKIILFCSFFLAAAFLFSFTARVAAWNPVELNDDWYPYQNGEEDYYELAVTAEATPAPTATPNASIQQADGDTMSTTIPIATEAAPEPAGKDNGSVTIKTVVSGLVLGLLFVGMMLVRIFGINKSVEFPEELEEE